MSQLQEDFDFVLDAIIGQGKPAMYGTGCMYLTSDGDRCAIGHLLRPAEIERMDGARVLTAYNTDRLPVRFHDNLDFYADLQDAHDKAAHDAHFAERFGRPPHFIGKFKSKMSALAIKYELDIPAALIAPAKPDTRTEPEVIEEAACALGDEIAAQARAA